jgi:predicted RNase H-like nuclease (RuvC/YqgF family)
MQSKYENLPVYKKALELTVYFETVVKGFDRYHKYTIGTELRNCSREILILIARANKKASRIDCLQKAIERLEDLKILIHVAKEVKAFKSFNSYEFSTKCTVEVIRQCEGWFKKSQNPAGNPPAGASLNEVTGRSFHPQGIRKQGIVPRQGSVPQGR